MTLERCNSQSCGQKIFKFKICHRKHHKKMVVISKNYFQKKILPLKFCLFWTSFSHSALTGKYLRSDHARAPRSTLKLSGLDLGALAWSLDNFTFDHARAPTSTLYHIEWILVPWHDLGALAWSWSCHGTKSHITGSSLDLGALTWSGS